MMRRITIVLLLLVAGLGGCKKSVEATADPRLPAVDERIRQQWGCSYDELPAVDLVILSPHNESIRNEFQWAFTLWHAEHFGQRVAIEWVDVGGASSSLEYIRNMYRASDTAGIDILWGGGELAFIALAGEGLLEPLDLSDEVRAAVPAMFGGLEMRDADDRWIGTAVSAFGFIYNRQRLVEQSIPTPELWEDLASDAMFGQLCLADPTQSGSAKAAYEMIVQSQDDWPSGWAQLLGVWSNAAEFVDSAGTAARAPVEGTAAVATAIDFYGTDTVARYPESLGFTLPVGQTVFTPDPIAILRNPPSLELAQRFVDFVMSPWGQALLALPVDAPDGPIESAIRRQPIRMDFYEVYAGQWLPELINPYDQGNDVLLDQELRQACSAVLPELVKAAAIDNDDELRAAREAINAETDPARRAAMWRQLTALPDNVQTVEQLREVSAILLTDERQASAIKEAWRAFFRETYQQIIQ
jgi:iron(III) transport system substrate-binding protein